MRYILDLVVLRRRVEMLDAASTGLHRFVVVGQLAGDTVFLSGILSLSRGWMRLKEIEGELQFEEGM
jgi:hypothetical protein